MFTNFKNSFTGRLNDKICSKINYHFLNAWLYYLVIYHSLQYTFQIDAILSDIHISQGSVATSLRRGGIFKHEFVAKLLLSPSMKKV